MVVLGDAGINFWEGSRDKKLKRKLNQMPLTFLCIHGNHEQRPENLPSYEKTERFGGTVYWEPEFPDLFFAKDGEIYIFNNKKCIAIGGAYSVDKYIRLRNEGGWWPDEQPSPATKAFVEKQLEKLDWKIDFVMSHTCPYQYIPREVFLDFIDQKTVDNSTEDWLNEIESKLDYTRWYCGHYHTNKSIDKMLFLFNGFIELIK
jgi:3-oxoacid CoA-transferase subunit A